MKYLIHRPGNIITELDVPRGLGGTAVIAFVLERHPEALRVEQRIAVCGRVKVHLIWEKK